MLRKPILAISGNSAVRRIVSSAPVTRDVVNRFIAGDTTTEAVASIVALRAGGLQVTCDFLGEDTTTAAQAEQTVTAYLELIAALDAAGCAEGAEMSVKLSAVGQSLPATADVPEGGNALATDAARRIVDAAYAVGARVTLDMEDHTTVDATLGTLTELRADQPDVGIAIQAMLLRTPQDLAGLIGPGSRVRLVKGAYNEPETVAHPDPDQVDLAYVRALKLLMAGQGYPMVGSHDPRLIAIASQLAKDNGRGKDSWEYQMLYGIRPEEQTRLAGRGHTVRVYLPYGDDWYGYFTRRLAERPANLAFFLRSFLTKK
ncbi:proline dehydrogenase family protein [Nakamurella sp. A5-74]|uniref:proline dehydrogenase n=1 Tax=Nakamurella sp. A5-74 TaxID=3158264 RepID=A0AAU8DX51_9ACTN